MRSLESVVGALVVLGGLVGCGAASAVRPSPGEGTPPASAGVAVLATVRLPGYGNDVATGADGRVYVSVSSNKLVVVDPASATVASTIDVDGEPFALAVTPDARRAYLVDLRGSEVAVVDTTTARQKTSIPMGTLERTALRPSAAVSRDGNWVYVGNTAKDHLFVIDTAPDQVYRDLFLDFHPTDVAVRSDGRYVFVAGCRLSCIDGTLRIVDTTTFKAVASIPLPSVPTGMVVTPDGAKAYVANGREATVTVVDLASQSVGRTLDVGAEPVGIAIDPSGATVYVTSFRDGTLTAIDTRASFVIGTTRVGASPRAVVVSPDGTKAFVTHSTSTLSIVDLGAFRR